MPINIAGMNFTEGGIETVRSVRISSTGNIISSSEPFVASVTKLVGLGKYVVTFVIGTFSVTPVATGTSLSSNVVVNNTTGNTSQMLFELHTADSGALVDANFDIMFQVQV